ncbi:hypothetical protein AKO1_010117 [Acrasis kona]|uniref:Uncharacterized protein n=1 Tax=Acrasis kona TaxID=1008807 RepID=A0AAW2ZT22_9EUKA
MTAEQKTDNNKVDEVKNKVISVLQVGVPAILLAVTTGQSVLVACTTMIIMPLLPWIIEQLLELFEQYVLNKNRNKDLTDMISVRLSTVEQTLEGSRCYNPHYESLQGYIQSVVSTKNFTLKPKNYCNKINWFFSPSGSDLMEFDWKDEDGKSHKFYSELQDPVKNENHEADDKIIVLYGETKELMDKFLKSIIMEKKESAASEQVKSIPWIYHYDIERKMWNSTKECANKSYDKLFMRTEDKTILMDDIENFKLMREVANELGIPYKRGYLLYGTPGCGKTIGRTCHR